MKVDGLTLYPLQRNVMNVFDHMQELMSSYGHTVLAYRPVVFFYIQNAQFKGKSNIGRLSKLRNIHQLKRRTVDKVSFTVYVL